MELILDRIYNDPNSPAGFAGIDLLWNEAQKIDHTITRKHVEEYLQNHSTYTQFRPRRIRFPRSKTVPAGYLTDVQCDLADMQNHAKENDGFKYILVSIDVLSKRIFAIPLKSKFSKDVIPAFEQMLSKMEMLPHRIFSDKGKELTNKEIRQFFKENEIDKYECNSSTVKASLAENAIKRIKQRIYRYFHRKGTYKWIDILEKIVHGINHAKSRVLGGLRPVDVSFENAQKIREQNYGPIEDLINPEITKVPRFKVDDYVRMSRNKPTFAKGYTPSFDNEILQIDKVKAARPPYGVVRYGVRDLKGEPFKGYFYEPDLTKVRKDENTPYRIEKELRREKDKEGRWKYLVQFYSDPVAQWINDSHII
jgi:hypothetical protein